MIVNLAPTNTGTVSGTVPINFASNGATTSGLGITPPPGQNLLRSPRSCEQLSRRRRNAEA